MLRVRSKVAFEGHRQKSNQGRQGPGPADCGESHPRYDPGSKGRGPATIAGAEAERRSSTSVMDHVLHSAALRDNQ